MLGTGADFLELTGGALFRDRLEHYTRSRLFDPLHDVGYERYIVYFRVSES